MCCDLHEDEALLVCRTATTGTQESSKSKALGTVPSDPPRLSACVGDDELHVLAPAPTTTAPAPAFTAPAAPTSASAESHGPAWRDWPAIEGLAQSDGCFGHEDAATLAPWEPGAGAEALGSRQPSKEGKEEELEEIHDLLLVQSTVKCRQTEAEALQLLL
jgi:hypothetical protein